MKLRALAIALAVLLVPAAAHAGGFYGGFGIGGDARLGKDLADRYDSADQTAGRLMLGRRSGPWAIEGVFFGTDLIDTADGQEVSSQSLGADLKYYLPLTSGLELYVRGGLHLARIEGIGQETVASGRGFDYGTGLQYAFRMFPALQAAVWIDLTKQAVTLGNDRFGGDMEGEIKMITLGVSIGTGL